MKKKIIVLGGGKSGTWVAILAKKKGYKVLLIDQFEIKSEFKDLLNKYAINFFERSETISNLKEFQLCIKSPGIPNENNIVEELLCLGIPIVSEVSFAAQFSNSKMIGITGTNGKTTTSELVFALLKGNARNVGLCGNIGTSLSQQILKEEKEWLVLELSSFQLEHVQELHLYSGAILNISVDHLDRYKNFETYQKTKYLLTNYIGREKKLILNWELKSKQKWTQEVECFSIEKKVGASCFVENEHIVLEEEKILKIEELPIKGIHNIENSLAAILLARDAGVSISSMSKSLREFKESPHRMELFLRQNKLTFINDSKATNIDATLKAIQSCKTQIIWLVGGTDKGNDFDCFLPLLGSKIIFVLCIGKNNQTILNAFQEYTCLVKELQTFKACLRFIASIKIKKSTTVLLSPACASFDFYQNYEDRGNQFKKVVLDFYKNA